MIFFGSLSFLSELASFISLHYLSSELDKLENIVKSKNYDNSNT